MAANGISTLATKQLRQEAKLDLAASNNELQYNLDYLPTKYDGNSVVVNENADGLLTGRPWIERMEAANPDIDIDAGGAEGPLAAFAVYRDTNYFVPDSSSIIPWDGIHYQFGFSPVLSGTISTVTVPSGLGITRAILAAKIGDGGAGPSYYELAIQKNGSLLSGSRNQFHGGFYLRVVTVFAIDVTGGDTVSAWVNVNNSLGEIRSKNAFTGVFY